LYVCDLDLDPMIFVYEHDPYLKMHTYLSKMIVPGEHFEKSEQYNCARRVTTAALHQIYNSSSRNASKTNIEFYIKTRSNNGNLFD